MCLSTTVREALVRGFEVYVDADATGARDLEHEVLGRQTADEVRRSALLQLTNMGAIVVGSGGSATATPPSPVARAGDILVVRAGQAHTFASIGEVPLRQVDIHASGRFVTEWLKREPSCSTVRSTSAEV